MSLSLNTVAPAPFSGGVMKVWQNHRIASCKCGGGGREIEFSCRISETSLDLITVSRNSQRTVNLHIPNRLGKVP